MAQTNPTGDSVKRPALTGSDFTHTILRNSLVITAGEWATRVLNFVVTIYIVRLLGEAGLGHYTTVVAFVGLFGVFFELGMTQYVQRTIAQDRSRAQSLFWTMVSLRLLLAFAGIAVITGLAVVFGYEPAMIQGILLFTGTFVLAAFLMPLMTVVTANEHFALSTTINFIGQLSTMALQILFLSTGAGFLGMLYVGYIVMPLQIALAVWAIRHYRLGPLGFRLSPSKWGEFVRASLPFGLSTLAMTYGFHADTVILGLFHTPVFVGWYNSAYRLVFNVVSITKGFNDAMTPSLAREHVANPARVGNWVHVSIQAIALFALPVAVGVSLVGPQLITFLYGDSFAPAGAVLVLIIWDVPFLAFNGFCGNITTAVGLERAASRILLFSTIVGVALYVLLIPPFGMLAAAGVTVFMDALTSLRFYLLLRRHLNLGNVGRKVAHTGMAAALMGGLVYLVRPLSLPLVVAAGIVSYGVLAIGMGLVDWSSLLLTARRIIRL